MSVAYKGVGGEGSGGCLEYFKLGFLEIQNVTIWSVFLNPVTYVK